MHSWRRIFLLIVAITVHNIPEGLAVGVGFGAIGKSPSATFQSAWSLALGKNPDSISSVTLGVWSEHWSSIPNCGQHLEFRKS